MTGNFVGRGNQYIQFGQDSVNGQPSVSNYQLSHIISGFERRPASPWPRDESPLLNKHDIQETLGHLVNPFCFCYNSLNSSKTGSTQDRAMQQEYLENF